MNPTMEELETDKESPSSEHITEVVKENLKLIRHTK
ncbi:XRE family transcriptional regulator, partial [Leptospira borgpetersenii serovar Tarassovi]|nr:XRE family transcriptional regulator [Leptospira borgpetersenii serovar Tarassovi]